MGTITILVKAGSVKEAILAAEVRGIRDVLAARPVRKPTRNSRSGEWALTVENDPTIFAAVAEWHGEGGVPVYGIGFPAGTCLCFAVGR